ncbi:ARPP-1 family domain-containing protein [Candidatus Moduliflexota bacterium]
MNESVEKCVRNLKFGEVQCFRDLCIVPIVGRAEEGPEYLTMEEAMGSDLLSVREVSDSGSVPELMVMNGAEKPVLLLDGEELKGAKQNRVLNATVLLAPQSRTVIPVSCTEQGRWSYESPEFMYSDVVMDHKVRHRKMASVSQSLSDCARYLSNQGEVWDEIGKFSREAEVHSPTGAMRDVFEERKADYNECLRSFPLLEGQTGLIAFIGDRPAGLDIVSRAGAFARLHGKLVRSYSSDTVFGRRREGKTVDENDCRAFVDRICAGTETGHPSAGLGEDCRYGSPHVCGSALVYRDTCIHGAFFADNDGAGASESMSSYRRRRANRKSGNN